MKKSKNSSSLANKSDTIDIRDKAILMESIIDAMPEFIIYYDEKLNVVWANRSAADDAKSIKEEMIGKNFFEAACGLKEPCNGCPVIKGLKSEDVEVIESNVYGGKLFYTRSYPIPYQKDRIKGRLFVAQDVSHLRNRYSVTEVLNLISEIFCSPKSLSEICEKIISAVVLRFNYPVGYITLYDRLLDEIEILGKIDLSDGFSEALIVSPITKYFTRKIVKDGSVINETGLDKIEDLTENGANDIWPKTILAVPLIIDGSIIGAMVLLDFKERLENNLMIDGLEAVANRLGAEIHRKQTEDKLREERNFTNAILNNAGPLVLVLDKEGRVVSFNKACERLTGYNYEEVSGKFIFDFLTTSKESEILRNIFPLVSEAALPPSFEGYWMSSDGKKHLIAWSNSLMGDVKAGNIHIVSIGIDITDKRKAEEEADLRKNQLLEADKMASLGILASGVAHEVNNPNNFIMMNTPILKDAWRDISPILEKYYSECEDFMVANMPYSEMRNEIPRLFEGIETGSERIRKIVMNMKDYTRKDIPAEPQLVDMNEVVTAAVSLLSYEIRKSTKYISVDTFESLPRVFGNTQKLEQVVVNLIQNACQALSDRNKVISIKTLHDSNKNEIIVSIIDQGVGINAEHLSHIGEPFFTTKSLKGGTGLGLSICLNIVKEHGGELEFKSRVGHGTEVRLSLPIARMGDIR
jgi:PAS domain S-box-containing protein